MTKKRLLLVIIAGFAALLVFLSQNKKQHVATPQEDIPSETGLPEAVEWAVPFTPQAPLGNWDDVQQGNGCEEASILMVYAWLNSTDLKPEPTAIEIEKLSDFSLNLLGHFHDISNEDTLKLMNEYFQSDFGYIEAKPNVELIKTKLAQGNVIIAAVNGDKLGNPYYQIPTPANHKIVVIGYDDRTQEFITHDPGTSRGEGTRYAYNQLLEAITDYPTGYRESFDQPAQSIIVISGNQT